MTRRQTLKVVRIGNSRGVRLPADWIALHGFETELIAESGPDGILLRPAKTNSQLSWEGTGMAIAEAGETYQTDFAATDADGLDSLDS